MNLLRSLKTLHEWKKWFVQFIVILQTSLTFTNHQIHVVPTATVLPCTPDDIDDMLSIIFIGPGKYKPDCLKNMFHVCKSKTWNFLVWLKNVVNNPLYQGITLDQRHVEIYPDSDVLPGIDKCVSVEFQWHLVHDTTLNAKQTFDDETTGFSDHLASQVGQDDGEGIVLYLEKLGVSDPENVLLHG